MTRELKVVKMLVRLNVIYIHYVKKIHELVADTYVFEQIVFTAISFGFNFLKDMQFSLVLLKCIVLFNDYDHCLVNDNIRLKY